MTDTITIPRSELVALRDALADQLCRACDTQDWACCKPAARSAVAAADARLAQPATDAVRPIECRPSVLKASMAAAIKAASEFMHDDDMREFLLSFAPQPAADVARSVDFPHRCTDRRECEYHGGCMYACGADVARHEPVELTDTEVDANSAQAVDELSEKQPFGAKLGLYDEHTVRRLVAAERAKMCSSSPVGADGGIDAARWQFVEEAANKMKTSRYEELCVLLGVDPVDLSLSVVIDDAIAAAQKGEL